MGEPGKLVQGQPGEGVTRDGHPVEDTIASFCSRVCVLGEGFQQGKHTHEACLLKDGVWV